MTWGRYDDRAPFHRKWFTLSNDAVATMWRATQWARSPEAAARPGFLTRAELQIHSRLSKRRFDKVLSELIHAGRPAHEHGLLEPTEDGFVIHDFEDYGPQQEEDDLSARRSDAARRAGEASAAARRARNGSAQPQRRSEPPFEQAEPESGVHPVAERVSNVPRTEFRTPPERVSNDSRTPGPDPDPEEILSAAAAKDLTPGARETAQSAAAAAPAAPDKVSCPADLRLSEDHLQRLHAEGVPDYAIAAATRRFLAKATNHDPRPLGAWHNSLYTAVQGMWMDPKQRPKPPESFEKPGTVKTNGGGEYAWYTMEDGRKVLGRY